jgi:Predicted pPIWI-associating nuclease
LREILREVLQRLAPDAEVAAQSWYKPVIRETPPPEPTHQQRARYILAKHGAGEREQEVSDRTLIVVETISRLARDMYSRTSVAAHTQKDVEEIQRLLRHFDALIHDLCR